MKLNQQFKQLETLLVATLAMVAVTVAALAENGALKIAVISFGLSGEQEYSAERPLARRALSPTASAAIRSSCVSILGKAVTQRWMRFPQR